MGLQRVGHDWVTFTFTVSRLEWMVSHPNHSICASQSQKVYLDIWLQGSEGQILGWHRSQSNCSFCSYWFYNLESGVYSLHAQFLHLKNETVKYISLRAMIKKKQNKAEKILSKVLYKCSFLRCSDGDDDDKNARGWGRGRREGV